MSKLLNKITDLENKIKNPPLNEDEQRELAALQEKMAGATICVRWTKPNYKPSQREQLEILRMMYQVVKKRMKK